MKKISIVIPCYNEAKTIREILARVEKVIFPGWEKEIIVVDDCSKDATRSILKEYENRLKVVYQEKNGGKGTAVRRGIAEAGGDYVIIQDADLEYDPSELPQFLALIDQGKTDVVYGSRNLHHEPRKGFLIPRLGAWAITQLVNILYGLKLTDVWTCYKLFPRAYGHFFVSGGFESELLFTAALAREGLRFNEVAISHNPRTVEEGKKITYWDGFNSIELLILDKLAHLRKPQVKQVKNLADLIVCPFCKKEVVQDSGSLNCVEHGFFSKDESGRPHLIEKQVLENHEDEHQSGVNWLKTFLKQFPRLYYSIWNIFCPVLMVQNGPQRFIRELSSEKIICDVGSGPERIGERVINIDVFAFPEVDIVADAHALPLRDSSIDMVVSESLLEHVADPQAVAREMTRVLAPRGLLYLSIPFVHPFHASPDDFNRLTTSGLKALFADLEVVETGVRSGPWSAFLLFMAYWLGVIFSFGSQKAAPFIAHIFMLILGPLKIFDPLFASMPGAEAVAAHVYIVAKKKETM